MPDAASRHLRVFLCHSSGDKPMVRDLYQRLKNEAWIDPWLDEEKLHVGQDWEYEIGEALDNSDAVIVILSTDSVSKEGFVQKELRFAMDIALEKPEGTIFILPLRLDDCVRPRKLRHLHSLDYFPPEDREKVYARLRSSLELRAEKLNILTKGLQSKQETPKAPAKKSKTKRTSRNTTGESKPKTRSPVIEKSVTPQKTKQGKVETTDFISIGRGIFSTPLFFRKVHSGKPVNDIEQKSIEVKKESEASIEIPYDFFYCTNGVDNGHYGAFVKAKGIEPPRIFGLGVNRTDINQASLGDAMKFCQWLDEIARNNNELPAGMVVRLPTVAEYKKATGRQGLLPPNFLPFLLKKLHEKILYPNERGMPITLVIAPKGSDKF